MDQSSEGWDAMDRSATIQRREWEIQLVEEEKKKLQNNKKKISAFGGLSSKVFEKDEDDDVVQVSFNSSYDFLYSYPVFQKPISKPIFATQSTSALLASLPPPKAAQTSKPQTSTLSFLPSTVKIKPVTKPAAAPPKPVKPESDDEGDSNTMNDFLGLGSLQKNELMDIRKLPRPEIAVTNMFVVDEPIGPARPPPMTTEVSYFLLIRSILIASMFVCFLFIDFHIFQEPTSQPSTSGLKTINDEAAKKLIYKHEIEQWGASNIFANDSVGGMIDVNADTIIGPNVRQTLLKNIDHRSLASFASGKQNRQGPKGPTDKLAKMKHQITHLASIAVAREDELKEQWAASRESKSASKRKYGF